MGYIVRFAIILASNYFCPNFNVNGIVHFISAYSYGTHFRMCCAQRTVQCVHCTVSTIHCGAVEQQRVYKIVHLSPCVNIIVHKIVRHGPCVNIIVHKIIHHGLQHYCTQNYTSWPLSQIVHKPVHHSSYLHIIVHKNVHHGL